MHKTLLKYGVYRKVVCIALIVFLRDFMLEHSVSYFTSIYNLIFETWVGYAYCLDVWAFVMVLDSLLPAKAQKSIGLPWQMYAVAAVNAILLSNAFFMAIVRLYYLSFDMRGLYISLLPLAGVYTLMFLNRFPWRQVVFFTIMLICVNIPIAVQWAHVACEGPCPRAPFLSLF